MVISRPLIQRLWVYNLLYKAINFLLFLEYYSKMSQKHLQAAMIKSLLYDLKRPLFLHRYKQALCHIDLNCQLIICYIFTFRSKYDMSSSFCLISWFSKALLVNSSKKSISKVLRGCLKDKRQIEPRFRECLRHRF